MLNMKIAAVVIGIYVAAMGSSAIAEASNGASAGQVKVIVNYSDLDLATGAGAQTLRERFEDAVTRIKGEDTDAFGSESSMARAAARRVAMAAADAVIKARCDTAATAAPTMVSLG